MTETINDFRILKTSDTITVFWKKPIVDINLYELILNEEIIATTNNTHYTFKDLKPHANYNIEIKCHIPNGRDAHANIQCSTKPKSRMIDVTASPYNAVNDGITMNTRAIQRAIDDCKKDQTVYIPKGVFLTGALRLHSDMELYLEEDAVLLGTDNPDDYLPMVRNRIGGVEQDSYASLINVGYLNHGEGYNCKNIVIRGRGTIASAGRELLNICNSQNVIISGITFRDSAAWNIHMIYSDNVVTTDCTFYSDDVGNTYGWYPDSSTYCAIFNCMFYAVGDSISIQSGKNPEGNMVERPTEHVWIFDCKCARGQGIIIGSEMSGGINDIEIWDCDLSKAASGIEIKATKKRGGYVVGVHVRDTVASRILFHALSDNDNSEAALTIPIFENCTFERMDILGYYPDRDSRLIECEALELVGFEYPGHELRNIVFRDIKLGTPEDTRHQTIRLHFCRNISFERLTVY